MKKLWICAGKLWSYPEITIDPQAYFLLAFWIYMFPIQWVTGAVTAAIIHECGHLIALQYCGIRIWGISVGCLGARIKTAEMNETQELICALSGPAAGALLVFFRSWIPHVSIWALVQTVFNLLPIYPLDGGRALKAFMKLISERKTT